MTELATHELRSYLAVENGAVSKSMSEWTTRRS
jgi:hypothetical protein